MLRHVWVFPCWHVNCRMRADVDTDVKQEQDLVTCRHWVSCCDLLFIQSECYVSKIPCSLATRANSHVNPKLMRNIRVWQWRWMNSKSKNLWGITGRSLKKRMAMWEEENIARVFKFRVNYRTSWKMHFKFSGNFKPISWNESIVSLWRKRHVFKTLKTAGAVFPRRDVYDIMGCRSWSHRARFCRKASYFRAIAGESVKWFFLVPVGRVTEWMIQRLSSIWRLSWLVNLQTQVDDLWFFLLWWQQPYRIPLVWNAQVWKHQGWQKFQDWSCPTPNAQDRPMTFPAPFATGSKMVSKWLASKLDG